MRLYLRLNWMLAVCFSVTGLMVTEDSLPGRTKLVALPQRSAVVIHLDNPQATLIEEERVITLQKGVNQVDFSWNGVSIDVDSIRLTPLSHPGKVALVNVSYPPDEAALVWEIHSPEAWEERVRISYLLSHIDRLIAHKVIADREESRLEFKCFLVLRNFSGEDFASARLLLGSGGAIDLDIRHEETKQFLFYKEQEVPIEKIWTFDASRMHWDPDKLDENVGIPVTYRIENSSKNGLGKFPLWAGKVRVYQQDGHGSTIVLGEDRPGFVPVGEKMEIYIGDSRDIVVTQHKMREKKINIRRNSTNRITLYDSDELIVAKIENFKGKPAVLTMIQHIPGQWDMEECNFKYRRIDFQTVEFKIELPAGARKELAMHYHRRNLGHNVSAL